MQSERACVLLSPNSLALGNPVARPWRRVAEEVTHATRVPPITRAQYAELMMTTSDNTTVLMLDAALLELAQSWDVVVVTQIGAKRSSSPLALASPSIRHPDGRIPLGSLAAWHWFIRTADAFNALR